METKNWSRTSEVKWGKRTRCANCGFEYGQMGEGYLVAEKRWSRERREYEFTGNWECRDLGFCLPRQKPAS